MKRHSIFFSYLRDQSGMFVIFFAIFGILTFLFYLYNYNLHAVLYSFLLSLVLILIFSICKYCRYYKRYKTLHHIQRNVESLSQFPVSGRCNERQLILSIHHLTNSLRQLEMENAQQQREVDTYYSMWVHQVKVPISAMRLTLQSNKTPENRLLGQELLKIEQYVEMALGYLRIDSMYSDLQFQEVNLHHLLSSTIKKFASTFIYQKLSVNLHEFQNTVITDKKWLRFVLEQLLSNALKYTKTGGIEIYMDRHDVLYIQDSGIGIAPEDLPRIFERGFTGNNGRIDQNATGLGLFLANKVMNWLHHRLEIRSELDKGTLCMLNLRRDYICKDD